MKLLFSLWLLLLATLVGVSIQQCALEDLNVIDLVLNTESNEFTDSPNMYINAIYYNCFSASQTIGLFTSTSLSVLYNKSDSAVLKEVRYNLQCMNGYWERVGRTSTALQNNDTRTDCYSCKDQTVNENHCSVCNSSCTGLNQCYGPMANQCCSYNDGGNCTDDCGMNREGNSTFHCVCSNFWTGAKCDVCSLLCENEGTQTSDCSRCLCVPGYDGIRCENNIDECDPDPCENNATCDDMVNDYSCQCIAGYTDKNCTSNIDECDPNPCENNGTCIDLINDYSCQCVAGFTDVNCTTNIDNCASSPCANNATCSDLVNDFSCTCTPGYAGKDCTIDIDECASDPCHNNGTCTDMVDSYSCDCVYGVGGKDCMLDTVDDCSPDSCQNGGICVDGINSYTCSCLAGFVGITCETDINECHSNPCQNNATCMDGINSYTCTCATGFTGTDCQINIDDCDPNPCKNGGTCTDGVDGFSCTCNPVYSGSDCSDCGIPKCIKCDVVSNKCLQCQEGYKVNENYDDDDDDDAQCVGETPEEGEGFKPNGRVMLGAIFICIVALIVIILLIIAVIIKSGVHRSRKDSQRTYHRYQDETDIGHESATVN